MMKLRGVVAPILTPFNDDLSIATDLFVAKANELMEAGCVGLAPFGTTGEALSVATPERLAALKALIDSGIPGERIVPGTGLCNLSDTSDLSKACLDLGCGGVMTLPPFYYKEATQEGLYDYFCALAGQIAGSAIYLYHIPQVSVVPIWPDLARRLFEEVEEVVGIKDSSGVWDNTEALLGIEGMIIYPASEATLMKALPLGATGSITATANLQASAIAELISTWDRDPAAAEALFGPIEKVRRAVQSRSFISPQKRVLALTEDPRWVNVRPPLSPCPVEDGEALAREIGRM
ncbi:MAG: dihydrodipicolinate synthase family protein [Pseudomonadota bacterium]